MKYYFLIFVLFFTFLMNCTQKSKENTKCQHCGMPSEKYPKWHVKLKSDTQTQWTCSPRCMLLLVQYHQTGTKKIIQPKKILVKDYYTLKEIDAKKAFFVSKSDVLGPMGADFVPFENKKSAQDFIKEHKSTTENLFSFEQINLEIIKKALE
jgi:nitrous oxide reductase accessory protein NosL